MADKSDSSTVANLETQQADSSRNQDVKSDQDKLDSPPSNPLQPVPTMEAPSQTNLNNELASIKVPTSNEVVLFNGESLDMWTNEGANSVVIQNEVLRLSRGGMIKTKRQFLNFVLVLDYRLQRGANVKQGGGVLLRMQAGRSLDNLEVQLASGETGDFWVGDNQNTMSLLQTNPSRTDASRPKRRKRFENVTERANDWNRLEVDCNADRIEVRLNGELANEAWGAVSKRGPIGLMSQDTDVEFRNIRIEIK